MMASHCYYESLLSNWNSVQLIVRWSINIFVNYVVIVSSFGQVFNQWHIYFVYVCVSMYIYKKPIWVHPFTVAHFKIKYSSSEYGLRCFGCWHFMEDFLISISENFFNYVCKINSCLSQQSHKTNQMGLREPSFNVTESLPCWYVYYK